MFTGTFQFIQNIQYYLMSRTGTCASTFILDLIPFVLPSRSSTPLDPARPLHPGICFCLLPTPPTAMLPIVGAAMLALAASPAIRAKFDSMMTACTLSPKAIECIDDRKMRALFKGVSAAAKEDSVRRAFLIVYEDLGPVRVAGDLIFGQLKKVAENAAARSAVLVDQTDDSEQTLAALSKTRLLFDMLDSDSSGGLSRKELLDSPELITVLRRDADERDESIIDRFLAVADDNRDGQVCRPPTRGRPHMHRGRPRMGACTAPAPRLHRACAAGTPSSPPCLHPSLSVPAQVTFLELVLGLYASASVSDSEAGVSLDLAGAEVQAALVGALERRRLSVPDGSPSSGGGRKRRGTPDERFDEMLRTCLEWERALQLADCTIEEVPDECEAEQGRFAIVLKGSFVGARTPDVAQALRICYGEYAALRFGGDIIFALLKKIVNNKLR